MQTEQKSPLRWVALTGMVCALFIIQFSCIIAPGMAGQIMETYQLTPAQFGMVANMPFLAGVLFGILTGNLGDRYGIKKMMTISLCVFILGALWRAYATSFVALAISSLVLGFGQAVINANSTKGIRLWFPGKDMGPAMGIYVCGASIGAGIALKIGAYMETPHQGFMICFVLAIIALVLWVLLYRTHPTELTSKEHVSMSQFKAIMTDRNVWLVSIMIFFIFGCSTTEQTYVNVALPAFSGTNDVATSSTIALVSTIAVALGSIFAPMVIGLFKRFVPVMVGICVINALILILVFVLPFGAPTFALFIIQGFFLGGMLSMGKSSPALLPNIDPANLGAVGGLQSTLQNIGAWCIAGYIIAPICQAVAGGDTLSLYIGIYTGAAICSILAGITIAFLPKRMPTNMETKLKLDAENAAKKDA